MKLKLNSDSQLFLVANFPCINEIKDMFLKAFAESSSNSKDLIQYYQGMISEQLYKYVNEGSQFMLTVQEEVQ